MSDNDEAEKKPEPQRTVAWNPEDVPGFESDAAESSGNAEAATAPPAGPGDGAPADTSAPTQRMPPRPPTGSNPTRKLPVQPGSDAGGSDGPGGGAVDAGATIAFTAEDVERLKQESEAQEEEADRLIGTMIRDKWKVLKRLGAGSFGTVYKVEDVTGGWIEALKILGVDRLTGSEAEEMRARFLREAQIMKRLGKDSKHIVGLSTYEEDFEAGLIYFLMELVEGKSLADALNDDGPFSVERTITIALQTCDALMAAHEGPEPVVHRDLKLENLMLTKDRSGDEIVKVLDFGIAKIAEREADSRLTTVGTLGTPGYAAPEQLRAEEVDGRTDLFSFGVILYALLTGRDPWLGNLAHEPTHQIYELMVATDRAEVRPMADSGVSISPAMVNIVMKLLRRDPEQRFQSARELRDALLRVTEGGSGVDTGSLRVVTDDDGVLVEIRDGRTVVAEGPTPCTANGIAAATYTVAVRDPRYEATETTVVLGAGAMQDVQLVTRKRPAGSKARPKPGRRSRKGRYAAGLLLLAAAGATAFAQPWGRTMDETALFNAVDAGTVSAVWVVDGGVEGGIQPLPVDALASVIMPFFSPVSEGDVVDIVNRLRAAGVTVDVSWEARRLTDLAREAQARNRYFGLVGGDVRSYALRLAELVPESAEATSLLLKVAERLAWDAEAALVDGPPERAGELVQECLALVPDHPRCLAVSESL